MRLKRRPHDQDVLGEFGDYLLEELRRSKQTARGYHQQLLATAKVTGRKVTEVSVKDIRYEVKRDDSVAVSTRNLRIAAFRHLHMWGLLEEAEWANPAMLGVKSIPEKRAPLPPISVWEARKALANCDVPNDYRVIYCGLYAGLRVSESAAIDDSNIHGDRIVLMGKGDKKRTIPLHPELAKVLPVFLSKKPKTKEVLGARFDQFRQKHNLHNTEGQRATTHSLRRTFADTLYDKNGVPQEVVAMLLGHGSSVTQLYAPVRFAKMQEAVLTLNYYAGEPIQLSFWD